MSNPFISPAQERQAAPQQGGQLPRSEHPGFEDFATPPSWPTTAQPIFRVDCFTPSSWAPGARPYTFIVAPPAPSSCANTSDLGPRTRATTFIWGTGLKGERHIPVHGKVGFPFFGH